MQVAMNEKICQDLLAEQPPTHPADWSYVHQAEIITVPTYNCLKPLHHMQI